MKIYDISVPISSTMPVWPGDPPVVVQQVAAISSGESANVSRIVMGAHSGTHIDAPRHFIADGKTIGQIPLEKLIGKVLVMEIDHTEDVISDQVLESHPNNDLLKNASKVLFRTRNSALWQAHPTDFYKNYVGIDSSGAHYLKNLDLDLIGIDYLSIAPYQDTLMPHLILLAEEIVLLEGLDLSQAPSGIYDLYCLPLNIPDCEGAPARVVLISN